MSQDYQNKKNLGNLEFTNFLLYIPLLGALYALWTYREKNERMAKLFFLVLLSFIILRIDIFGGPFDIFETKKNKVDYKKLIFIMIYISIAFLYYNLNENNDENKIDGKIVKIKNWFPKILIGIAIVFSFLNTEDETFLTFEYLLYHWIIFIMIFSFYNLTNAVKYPYAKMYLTIMMIISVLFMLIKPFIDVMVGLKTWKYSNYKYFNNNINKKNNKNVLNNLMNYIIINIVLLSVYVALTYSLLGYGKIRYGKDRS